MKEEISKLLKLTFLIHFFVAVIFGLVFLFIVELYVGLVTWPYLDPVTGRVLGAVFMGLAASSLLSWRETRWESVKIVVQMEIVWSALGTAVQIFAVFTFPSLPFMIWVQIGILIFFFVAFMWFYWDQEWAK
ncbi:MAG: hypothetical protein HWN80_04905 [Candidatus Lokiarchaeota archaeon]|nr:hypothetical protein [Candidatus Lokiarchaeota archaeon]